MKKKISDLSQQEIFSSISILRHAQDYASPGNYYDYEHKIKDLLNELERRKNQEQLHQLLKEIKEQIDWRQENIF